MLLPLVAIVLSGAQVAQDSPVGLYDGGGFEMAAGLELTADGRFRYALSVGSYDEEASGRWRSADGRLLLTSDPVTPPVIALVSQATGTRGKLDIAFEGPRGIDPQYFELRLTGDEAREVQLEGAQTRIDLPAGRPLRVSLALGLYDVESAVVEVDPARGARLAFRFTANDLGKVAFDDAELVRDGDLLTLDRKGGTMRFRRVK
ncbi:hypothetical protein [Sphingomonas sp.]|uniref:hypothetical protein n=1 Tax=Sphingomonas sp. TaxID=28214 RepID=UPI002DD696B6|nr:hypothetical protein [Sphingomonas sp.]